MELLNNDEDGLAEQSNIDIGKIFMDEIIALSDNFGGGWNLLSLEVIFVGHKNIVLFRSDMFYAGGRAI